MVFRVEGGETKFSIVFGHVVIMEVPPFQAYPHARQADSRRIYDPTFDRGSLTTRPDQCLGAPRNIPEGVR